MIKNEELKIHYREIPERIRSYFGKNIQDQHELDTWDFDLRNQTLLHRNTTGYYEFAHKSLAEYFVAFKFAAELKILDSLYTQTYCDDLADYCQKHFSRTSISELVDTFGSTKLTDKKMKAIYDLLCEMVSENANNKLWEIVEYTKNKEAESIRYLGGNAATFLLQRGEKFEKRNLEKTVLRGGNFNCFPILANFEKANLRGSDLRGANFEGASLREAKLKEANLEKANLKEANLRNSDIREANLKGANLEGANLIEANLRDSNLIEANLRDSNLIEANLGRANLERANLERATLVRASLIMTKFIGANLEGANLEGADLRKAYFDGANLREANLKGANLEGADLENANLIGAILDYAKLEGTKVPFYLKHPISR